MRYCDKILRPRFSTHLQQADPRDLAFFGGGGGGGGEETKKKLKIWDKSLPFDITKAVSFRGILFARSDSHLAKTQVIPSLPYFHEDSGTAFNFWCVGYSENDASSAPVTVIGGKKWDFDVSSFTAVKKDLEKHTRWKYKGGVDLILCNEIKDIDGYESWLELKSSVCLSIDELLHNGYISSFETFFQEVINFAASYQGSSPSWDFSDSQGLRLAGKSLRESVVHLLPESFRKTASEAEHFAVRNIGK